MANVVYQAFKKGLLNSQINFGTSNINLMLVNGYSPIGTSDAFQSAVGSESSGIGYVTGGTTLTGGTVTAAGGTAVYTASNPVWGTSTITATGGVLYQYLGTNPATNPLIGYLDFSGSQISSAGNFTVQWNAQGIVNLT
jgi:hypothetical protein